MSVKGLLVNREQMWPNCQTASYVARRWRTWLAPAKTYGSPYKCQRPEDNDVTGKGKKVLSLLCMYQKYLFPRKSRCAVFVFFGIQSNIQRSPRGTHWTTLACFLSSIFSFLRFPLLSLLFFLFMHAVARHTDTHTLSL